MPLNTGSWATIKPDQTISGATTNDVFPPQPIELFRSVPKTDVVLVIGANDVVNPLARSADPSIPIAGMPILNVDEAHSVVIVKRSLNPGFAGIANPLFAADNSLMLFGDAKQMAMELVTALKKT